MYKLAIFLFLLGMAFNSIGQNKEFVPIKMGGSCCCGQFEEIFYPNLDFEDAPAPPPGGLILYSAGDFFSGWTCTRATVDHKDAFFGNLTLGNPNGRSNFIDLHGSPGFGAIEYNLTGLTPGNTYRIDFWTAQNGSGYTSTGTLKVAGGAWLNVNWNVDTDGSVFWFKVSHFFMAMATSAKMEFSSVGGSEWGGALLDDITIYECPGDQELPMVDNPPDDVDVECDSEIPKVPVLIVSDNCDPSPMITFKETIEIIDPCTKNITRTWTIKDDCGNVHVEVQRIHVEDKTAPEFTTEPQDKFVICSSDIKKLFADWIKKNGNAVAIDACGKVSWRTTIDHNPQKSCDSILVEFIAMDPCGQENSAFANFYVLDTLAPVISKPAENKIFYCITNTQDSLFAWLKNNGYAAAQDNCDTTLWSNNFNGDSTMSNILVHFYAKDLCGNIDSTAATFIHRTNSDTFRIFQNSCSIPFSKMDTFTFSVNACDSIVIVSNIKVQSDTIFLTFNTCDPNQSKVDTVFLKNQNTCDSIVIRRFILQALNVNYIKDFSCNYISNTIDTLILKGQYCDSFIITEHIPLKKDSTRILSKTCDSTKIGIVFLNLSNQFNCDSIIQIVTSYTAQTISQKNSYECGLKFTYSDTLKFTTNLCDSLVITNHIPLIQDSNYISTYTCNFSNAGIFKNIFKNKFGCDSIVIHEIILNPSDTILISKRSCNSVDTGSIKQIFTNQFGCDSILVTHTLLKASDSINITQVTCKASEVGIVKRILKNTNGCDSLVVTQTNFEISDTTFLFNQTCLFHEQRNDTFIYKTLTCDSLVINQILFVASDTNYVQQNTCLQTEAGLDTIYMLNSRGCDSLIFKNTIYVPLKLKYRIDSISCFNQNDGVFQILNVVDFSSSFQLFLDNTSYTNQDRIENLSPGGHLIYIRDQNGCLTDSLSFYLLNPEALITDLGNNLEVQKGSRVDLSLQSNFKLQQILWQPSTLTNCQNCQQISIVADHDQWVYSFAIDERNCSSLDSLLIRVKKSSYVYAPNVISANGDQINDYFYLIADAQSVIEVLNIYDRWGELLFSANHIEPNKPETGWDGRFKNKKMNPGVYLYYAKIKSSDGDIKVIQGDFTLIR